MAKSKTPWMGLTPAGRARLKKDGVSPQAYNAWEKKTPAQKKAAQAKGVTAADFKRGKTPEQQKRHARTVAQREVKTEKRTAAKSNISDLTGGRANPAAVDKLLKGLTDAELDDIAEFDRDDLLDWVADNDDPKHKYKRLYSTD